VQTYGDADRLALARRAKSANIPRHPNAVTQMILPFYHLKRIMPESWQARLRFISRRLPRQWFYYTNDRRLWRFTGETELMQQRPNLVRYELQPGCFLETYLIDQTSPDGTRYFGPAAGLVVHGSEIIRFDCVGHPLGHYHAARAYPYGIRKGLAGELWLPEKTMEDQVERAMFEVQRNWSYYLTSHPRRKVRNTRFDQDRLAALCAKMKSKMLDDVRRDAEPRAAALP
jgi:hypothetical protein